MERTLLLASGFWIGGVAAWAPIAGYLLAPHCRQRTQRTHILHCQEGADQQPEESSMLALPLQRPDDPGALLTESERMRLAPPHNLKRKRRSRKIRKIDPVEEKFIPLVEGARQSVSESIVAAYSGDSLESKQKAGEDFWIDPALLEDEVQKRRAAESSRKMYQRKKTGYKTERLKEELVSPYKNNAIGFIVVGIGLAATVLSFFPELLELTDVEPNFPDTL
uniref:Transmembrane protein n=1 Tax=Coccolithus braarudii TaxID=221442 RepID=A0A7S0Q3Q1_9EUKA|mmetsp:Transcript_44617/g.94869  ORF Transcript_44617/g.94869 Transcript_44617/m.94869 type:complete len:222 (+) Transcript_44617:161-826(+)